MQCEWFSDLLSNYTVNPKDDQEGPALKDYENIPKLQLWNCQSPKIMIQENL